MIGAAPCMICHDKNNSSSLEQLKRIRDFLRTHKCENLNNADNKIKRFDIANAFMMSTHNHCRYGLSCPSLLRMTSEANNIARNIEKDITDYIQNANKAELYELLCFTQGYFPQAYSAIERYWYEYHK